MTKLLGSRWSMGLPLVAVLATGGWIPAAAQTAGEPDELQAPLTGETLEGTIPVHRHEPVSLDEMREVTVEALNVVKAQMAKMALDLPRDIPPLQFTVPVDPTMTAPEVPPSSLGGTSLAPDDFAVFKNTNPSSAAPGFTSIVNEPTVVAVDESVFYTGNWYAADSTDGGDSFGFVNPFAGPFPPPDNGFCCDQVTAYDPETSTTFYVQQSFADTDNGTHRINVDQMSDGTFDCFYNITPAILGFGANTWPDFPDLALSDDFIHHSANVYHTTNGSFQGAFVARYAMAQMSSCGSVPFKVYKDTGGFFSFKLTRGATDVMYFADHISNASMRIWRWPESADAPTSFDRSVTAWNDATRVCPGPDGRDWCGRIDRRLAAAWVADGVVGFMWVPSQGSGFPYPYTRIARFSTFGLIRLDEPAIWSDQFAWAYSSVAANRNGDLGGTIMAGGGPSLYPTCVAWLADDSNGDTIAPLENTVAYFGTSGPQANISGDYNSTAVYYPNDQLFAGACFALDSTTTGHSRFILFGREGQRSIFTDGFESGDLSAWTSFTGAGRLNVVGGMAVVNGDNGLEVTVGSDCPPPADILLTGNFSGTQGSCTKITTSNLSIDAPGAVLQAPAIEIGNTLTVPPNVPFQASSVDPNHAWVVDGSPANAAQYHASFRLNLDMLSLAVGDSLEILAGFDSGGQSPFRLILRDTGPGLGLALAARLNGGGAVETPVGFELPLPGGWIEFEVHWTTGAGDGALRISTNGAPLGELVMLDNSGLRLESVRFGSLSGASDPATAGKIKMDLYGSWLELD